MSLRKSCSDCIDYRRHVDSEICVKLHVGDFSRYDFITNNFAASVWTVDDAAVFPLFALLVEQEKSLKLAECSENDVDAALDRHGVRIAASEVVRVDNLLRESACNLDG